MATGSCDKLGYSWSDWQDQDDPTESGDWELRSDQVCANPLALKAMSVSGQVDNVTLIDLDIGFCQDYRVSWCCPDLIEGTCDSYGYSWKNWVDVDDPDGLGDMEIKTSFSEFDVCDEPEGIKARKVRLKFYNYNDYLQISKNK